MTRTQAMRLLAIAGQIGLTVLVFWILAGRIDFSTVFAYAGTLGPAVVAIVAALFVAQITVVALRLQLVTRLVAREISFSSSLALLFVGAFFAQTPLSILGGDVVKAWMLHRDGLTFPAAANSILLDRVYGTLALLAVFLAVLVPFWLMLDDVLLRTGSITVVGLGLAGIATMMSLRRLPEGIRRFRLARWVHEVGSSFTRIFVAPRMLAPTIGFGVAAHLLSIAIIYAFFHALEVDATLGQVIVLAPFPLLASLLPISIGGWGMRESAMVLAFGTIGVPPEQSLAASLLFGLTMLIASLPGGLIWFLALRRRRSQKLVAEDGAT